MSRPSFSPWCEYEPACVCARMHVCEGVWLHITSWPPGAQAAFPGGTEEMKADRLWQQMLL